MTGAGLDRRTFLLGLLAGAGAVACGSDGGSSSSSATAAAGPRATVEPVDAPALPAGVTGPVFTLGVASGDPLADRVILWTRLAPTPLVGAGGMPDVDVDVAWEVGTDDTFSELVATGIATATTTLGHSLHVDATGLAPDTWYAYRFRVGDETSSVGRTRTFPAADTSPERLRLAVTNCQDYQSGRYAAYRDLAAQDLDVVLFLGDYIYETPGIEDPARAVAERRYLGGVPTVLDDFRRRYAQHHLDPQLLAAHQALPWIITIDDHEVINNYAGDDGFAVGAGPDFVARRTAAYQAWYENLPLRIEPPVGGAVNVNRDSTFGDLARLFVIETRQFADVPPCRDTSTFDAGPGCEDQQDPDRTALGVEQRKWLLDGMAENTATWQVLVNPVLLGGLDISAPGESPAYFLEIWDGYPAERRTIAESLAGLRNPVVLSGDYHASFVLDVRADPWDESSPIVAPELLATAISSAPFAEDYTAKNPHVQYFEPRNGYLVCEVTPDGIAADFRYVADVADADSPVTSGATFVVRPGVDGAAPTAERS